VHSDSSREAQLQLLLGLNDDDLYTQLGQELLGEGIAFGPENRESRQRFAKAWLQAKWDEMRAHLCGDGTVVALLEGAAGDRLTEAAVVADSLVYFLAGHPGATTAAVIIARRGIVGLCD
jgi:hypothetical protein